MRLSTLFCILGCFFLLMNTTQGLNIYNHWGLWISTGEDSGADPDQRSYVKNSLVPPMTSYWNKVIERKHEITGSITANSGNWGCPERVSFNDVPSTWEAGYDHVIIWIWAPLTAVARTTVCYVSQDAYRQPLVTVTEVGWASEDSWRFTSFIEREAQITALMHEIFHGLGFNRGSMKNWIDEANSTPSNPQKYSSGVWTEDNEEGSDESWILSTPKITEYLQTHHDCPSIEGLALEWRGVTVPQDGHIRATLYPMEFQISGKRWGLRITNVSLIALSDSGWYDIDFDFAEPNPWAKNVGCDYFDNNIAQNNAQYGGWRDNGEFCNRDDDEYGCDFFGRFKSQCLLRFPKNNYDTSSGNQPSVTLFSNKGGWDGTKYDCWDKTGEDTGILGERGWGNGCLNVAMSGEVRQPYCFPFECSQDEETEEWSLTVNFDGTTHECLEGQPLNLPNQEGTVFCPNNIERYCAVTEKYCVRGCYNNGQCNTSKKCECFDGWQGEDCSIPTEWAVDEEIDI